jgi:hypothetical protein|tara:strand:+ start:1482 stop:1652 length:171 start_codon:yes stop_codon:yes gene_type:complete
MDNLTKTIAEFINKSLQWHKDFLYNWQAKYAIEDYNMWWLAFGKGVITVLLLQWIF